MPRDKRYSVEGYWDCQYCGRKGIKGRFKSCTSCGHPRDASVSFYTIDIDADHAITHEEFEREAKEADKNSRSSSANYTQAREATSDEASLFGRTAGEGRGDSRDAHDNTDWYCDYCDSYNPASATNCQFCGAEREMSSGKTYQQAQGTMARTYDERGNLISERDLSKRATPPATVAKPKRRGIPGCLKWFIVAAVIACVGALAYALFFAPKPRDVTVDSFDWTQTIEIEQLQTVNEDDWSLPGEARLIRSSEEVREYKQVLDHYETVEYEVSEEVLDHYDTYTTTVDNGDGTFDVEEHQEPVYRTEYRTETREDPVYVSVPIYDTKYYYEIERWVHERDVTTSANDHEPYWGEVTLSEATGQYGTGAEREGNRTGTYGVTDTEGNRYTADEDLWRSLEKGQTVRVMVDSEGHMTQSEDE